MSARDLKVLESAELLAVAVYRATRSFPAFERYGLSSQIQRAAVSIGSNIAEGAERSTRADFARFLSISLGSLAELQFQLRVARELDYVTGTELDSLSAEIAAIRRSLVALRRSVSPTGNR